MFYLIRACAWEENSYMESLIGMRQRRCRVNCFAVSRMKGTYEYPNSRGKFTFF